MYLGATEATAAERRRTLRRQHAAAHVIGPSARSSPDQSAELDAAAAAAGYGVPIATTATGAYAQMQQAAQAGAAWLVLRDVFPNVSGTADRSSIASEYRDAYRGFLKMLREGTVPLVGAAQDTGTSGRQLPRSRGIATPNIGICTRF
jgi:hypothetical protein